MATRKKSAASKVVPPARMGELEENLWKVATGTGKCLAILPGEHMPSHILDSIRPVDPGWKNAVFAVGMGREVYLEPVRLPSGNMLLVDEEGLLKGLQINIPATAVARQANAAEGIVGVAVFVPKSHVKKVLG